MYWCSTSSNKEKPCYEGRETFTSRTDGGVQDITIKLYDYKTGENTGVTADGKVGPRSKVNLSIKTIYQGEDNENMSVNKMSRVRDFVQENNLITYNTQSNLVAKTSSKWAAITYSLDSDYYTSRGWVYDGYDDNNIGNLKDFSSDDFGKSIIKKIEVDGKSVRLDNTISEDARTVAITTCSLNLLKDVQKEGVVKDKNGDCYKTTAKTKYVGCESYKYEYDCFLKLKKCHETRFRAKCPVDTNKEAYFSCGKNDSQYKCVYYEKTPTTCVDKQNDVTRCHWYTHKFKRLGT